MFRSKTLRKMPPETRAFAKLLNELESVCRRGKNLVPKLERLERDSQALATAKGSKPILAPVESDEQGIDDLQL